MKLSCLFEKFFSFSLGAYIPLLQDLQTCTFRQLEEIYSAPCMRVLFIFGFL